MTTTNYTVTIAGAALKILAGSLDIELAIGRRSTCAFDVEDDQAAHHFNQGDQILLYDGNGTLVFGGFVQSSREKKASYSGVVIHTISGMDYHYLADKRMVAAAYQNMTTDQIVNDIVSNYLSAEGVSVHTGVTYHGTTVSGPSVVRGVNVNAITFNYESIASCLDKLAKMDNYWWAIDQNKVLWYQPYTGVPAPWAVTGADDAEFGTTEANRGNTEYRNRQWVVGGKTQTASQTNTFKGDGATQTFTCSYPLAAAPTVTLNGASQTVGIKGVDTGKQWYWAKDDPVIAQDSSGTAIASTDTLRAVFVGEYPLIALTTDTNLVSSEKARSGGTGYVEAKYEDANISGMNAAFQIGNALIGHYGVAATALTYSTLKSGLQPGQLQTVTLPEHGLNGASMLIENVKINDSDGINIWYSVTALMGPNDVNWQTFWTNLLKKSQVQIDQNNQSTPQIVAILENEPLDWSASWTVTETETIWMCPVPSPTLYPGSTLHPC